MKRDPIRLVLRKGSDVANKKRVINMGMEIPIKYGLKVDFRGDVHGGSMQKLLAYRNEIGARMVPSSHQNLQLMTDLLGACDLAEEWLPGLSIPSWWFEAE